LWLISECRALEISEQTTTSGLLMAARLDCPGRE